MTFAFIQKQCTTEAVCAVAAAKSQKFPFKESTGIWTYNLLIGKLLLDLE